MTRSSRQVDGGNRAPLFAVLPAILVGFLLLLGALPGAAAAADAPALSKEDADHLIATLEDPGARQRLEANIRALSAADRNGQAKEQPSLFALLSDEMGDLSDEVLETVSALGDVGHLVAWVERQAMDPGLRSQWGEVLLKFVAILGGGYIFEKLAGLALTKPRGLIERRRPGNRWLRIPLALARALLDLLPIGVFIISAQVLRALTLLQLDAGGRQALNLLITAYILIRIILVLVRGVLMPGTSALRLVVLDDESANYLAIWAKRLTLTGVWGFYLVQALKLLGLPKSSYNFSLKLLGLIFTTLLVILVLQNRQAVSRWIRKQGERRGLSAAVRGLRNRFADIWHILATLYILATFIIWALQIKGGFEFVLQASALSIVIFVAANLLARSLARLVERAFSISETLRQEYPLLEERANRYLAIMHNMVRTVVVVATVIALAQAWGVNALAWLTSDVGRRLVSSLVSIFLVLIVALIIWEFVNASIERYLARTDEEGRAPGRGARARTLLPLVRNLVMIVLSVVVTLIVLSELGVDIAPLLAGAGVVGVAIGFGSQKLVQDVITGAFMLFENTIALGDNVQIGSYAGVVEGMTIRTMRLRDGNGQVHTLPFSSVNSVTNFSRDFSYFVINVPIALKSDVDQAIAAITETAQQVIADPALNPVILSDLELWGVDKFTEAGMVIAGRIKTLPGQQASVGRAFNRRLKTRFDELGISLPNPSHTVYLGDGGAAGPLSIRLEQPEGATPPSGAA